MQTVDAILEPYKNGKERLEHAARGIRFENADLPVKTRRVCIVGKAPDTRDMAPYGQPDWEFWGLGMGAEYMKQWDRWFEIHPLDENRQRWGEKYWKFLCTDHGKPLYINGTHPEMPHAKAFPLDEIVNKFGRYFTNSISFMLAQAINEQVSEIGLFGVNMAVSDPVKSQNGEFQYQRPSCEYFIGLAVGLGIKVTIPAASDLLKTGAMYGFDANRDAVRKKWEARKKELQQRKAHAEQRMEQAKQEALVCAGAIDNGEYWHNTMFA